MKIDKEKDKKLGLNQSEFFGSRFDNAFQTKKMRLTTALRANLKKRKEQARKKKMTS